MNIAANFSSTVPASGETQQTSVGSYKFIFFRSATGDFQFSFDGTSWFDGFEGLNLGPLPLAASSVYLRNLDGVSAAVTVKFYVSNFPVLSPPDVLISRPAPTYAVGNMGFGSQADLTAGNGQYVSGIALVAGHLGTKYKQYDTLTIAGGTGPAVLIVVNAVNAQGAITDASLRSQHKGNYSVLPASPNTPTGGSGSGAQFTLAFTAFTNAVLNWAAGFLTITNAAPFIVPNTNAGNARKCITFACSPASAAPLLILDSAGRFFCDVEVGQKLIFESGDNFQVVSGNGNLCTFLIGELYYL